MVPRGVGLTVNRQDGTRGSCVCHSMVGSFSCPFLMLPFTILVDMSQPKTYDDDVVLRRIELISGQRKGTDVNFLIICGERYD